MAAENETLLAAVIADPANPEAFSIYADSLEAKGDPRGQLISLMLAREKTPTRKLYAAQQELLEKHRASLGVDDDQSRGWWRGFVREVELESIEALSALDDPRMSLVDSATLVLAGDAWDEWLEAIGTRPWRRVELRLDAADDPLPLAALFEALPNLEELLISFGPDYELAGGLDFVDARSLTLKRLALEHVSELPSLSADDFPALEELWAIRSEGLAALRECSCWPKLKRAVIDAERLLPEEESSVIRGFETPDENGADAFVVIAEAVDPALVRTLVSATPGLERLAGHFGSLRIRGRPFTVIRLLGTGATQLFPYAVARSLERHHGKRRVPIVSFALSDYADRAQGYAVSPEIAAEQRGHTHRAEVVRGMLDQSLGFDPGIGVLEALTYALACGTTVELVGKDDADRWGELPLLAEIDPGVKPPPDSEDDDDYGGASDMFAELEVPEPIAVPAGMLPEVLPDEPPLEAVEEEDAPEDEEPPIDGLPDDPDHIWAEGPVDPDPDWSELKEDPDADVDLPLNAELLAAEAACARCDQAAPLRRCVECADLCCAHCARERRNVVTCLRCAP